MLVLLLPLFSQVRPARCGALLGSAIRRAMYAALSFVFEVACFQVALVHLQRNIHSQQDELSREQLIPVRTLTLLAARRINVRGRSLIELYSDVSMLLEIFC